MNAAFQKFLIFTYLLISQTKLMSYSEEDIKDIPKRMSHPYDVPQLAKLEERLGTLESLSTPGTLTGDNATVVADPLGTATQPAGNVTIAADPLGVAVPGNGTAVITAGPVTLSGLSKNDIAIGAANDATLQAMNDVGIIADEDVIIEADPDGTAVSGVAILKAGSVTLPSLAKNDIAIIADGKTIIQAMDIATIESLDKDVRIAADSDGDATGSDGTGDFGKVIITAGPTSFSGLDKGDIAIGANNDIDIQAMNSAKFESIEQDIEICADIDGSSTGKLNIKSGTSTAAANNPGEIGISAENDVILKSNSGNIVLMGNVTGLTSIGGDDAAPASGNPGDTITISGGNGDGAGSGGNATLSGGDGGVTGPGGNASITGGDAGTGSNDPGGNVSITGGDGDGTGNGGNITISGGATGSGTTGTVNIDGSSIMIESTDTDIDITANENVNITATTGSIILDSEDKNICIQVDTDGSATNPDGHIKITAGNVTSTPTKNEIHIIADQDITICSVNGIVNIEGLAVDNDSIIVDTSATGGIMGSTAGVGTNNNGGDIKVFSGQGDGTGEGGDVIIKAETSTGSGNDGNVRILTGGLSFTPTLSDGDIGLKASGEIIAESDSSITLETTQPNDDIILTAGDGTGSADINLLGKNQNINLISLILHILKAARIQPQTTLGSICFSNLNNDGKSRATYDGIPFTLTMDSDAGTLNIIAPGASSAPSPATLRLGDGLTSTTTTTGVNMVAIQWLANGRIEVTSTT